jgi:ribosomal protein L37AE/L43A
MDKLVFIWKSTVSALPFILVVIVFIVARSVYLMKKRNTRFKDWLVKEDADEDRRLSSIEKKKCPDCGTPFTESIPIQKCRKCGYELMKTHDDVDAYLNFMHKRYIRHVIPTCIVLSFIPILGFIVGLLYLKAVIINPFAQYIPFVKRFRTTWTLRLFVVSLAVFQILPGFGAISVPLVAYVKYWFFSSAYLEILEEKRKELAKS